MAAVRIILPGPAVVRVEEVTPVAEKLSMGALMIRFPVPYC